MHIATLTFAVGAVMSVVNDMLYSSPETVRISARSQTSTTPVLDALAPPSLGV